MPNFFKTSHVVTVSRITENGWWVENCQEHVAKGTALGKDFVQIVYTPSTEGMIARYDHDTNTWSDEIEDMTWKEFFSDLGQSFVIGEPDGDYPAWAVLEKPPEYNINSQTVLYTSANGWKVYPIRIGELYYDEVGNEQIVADYNFDLPENHSWDAPPKAPKGFAYKLVKGEWTKFEDHRGKWAYAKTRNKFDDYEIDELGPTPDSHTLDAPNGFDSWVDNTGWKYDIERHRPVKESEERRWRDYILSKVLGRIDQYEKEQQYPEELRTSPIENNEQLLQLLQDRKILSDYPEAPNFPFSERPILSGLAN